MKKNEGKNEGIQTDKLEVNFSELELKLKNVENKYSTRDIKTSNFERDLDNLKQQDR